MKVAIAIDSFKGSLSSIEAGTAAAAGVKRVFPDAVCEVRPLADGGEGTVDALLDASGADIPRGAGLAKLAKIEIPQTLGSQRLTFNFKIACDVKNPLCGPNGASAVFGPQKGATPERVATLDAALANLARVSRASSASRDAIDAIASNASNDPNDFGESPGAGAAGGLGFAFKAFLNAELVPGVDLIVCKVTPAYALFFGTFLGGLLGGGGLIDTVSAMISGIQSMT